MPGLNRMREAIRRFTAPTDTAGAEVNRTGGVHRSRQAIHMLFAAFRRWDDVCRRFQEQMQETRRDGEWLCRETMRKERRARRRSLVLLLRQMDPEQRREFRQHRYFHVTGGSTGDIYRIRVDMIANIDVLRSDGKVRHRLCVRPGGDIPIYDVMAAQLLHLQDPATEYRFLRTANIHTTLPEDHLCLRSTWVS